MKPRALAGFTIVEVMIAVALIAAVFGIYAIAVTDAVGFTAHNVGAAGLHEIGRRALGAIAADIAVTGRFSDPVLGIGLPHVFSNGVPDPALMAWFEHDAAALAAIVAGFPPPPPPPPPQNPQPFVAPGFELSPLGIREFVFRRPADVDGDGRPVAAATGNIEWDPGLIGYILRPNALGALDLVRRTVDAGGQVRDGIVCRCVEAMTFDTAATRGVLPAGAVEIHLHLRRRDTRNREQRLHLGTTVVMRNSP